ncbi:MAG: hypothetical protein WBW92_08665 [Rhodanobacteraceae bacterium]
MSADQATTQWWVVGLGDTLVWSRLRLLQDGHAEIFAADGRTMHFESHGAARAALLDAEFRAFDGLDEEDAGMLGFDLASTSPPFADTDKELMPLMTQRLTGHA